MRSCVPSTEPVFAADDLKVGVHINASEPYFPFRALRALSTSAHSLVLAVGSYTPSMREFPPSLITAPSPSSSKISHATRPYIPTILVDSREACLSEAGELIDAAIPAESCIELGEVVDGDGRGVTGAEKQLRSSGRSLFKCVGVGGMDVAVTELVVRSAEERGMGVLAPF